MTIIDIKTGANYQEYCIQTSGYEILIKGGTSEGIEFDEDNHIYKIKNTLKPSVTKIIGVALKSDDQFRNEDAMKKGTTVHKTLEFLDKGILDRYDQKLQPFIDGWSKFNKDYGISSYDAIESALFHPQLNFCGTIDRYIKDLDLF